VKERTRSRESQRGAVLIVALLLLAATTFIGFSTMETSSLQSKMATARELEELTFQAAEAIVEMSLDDLACIGEAHAVGLRGGTDWPTRDYAFEHDARIAGGSEVRFIDGATSPGHSLRKGAAGMATYYYEVESTARRTGTHIASTHVQGFYMRGPGPN